MFLLQCYKIDLISFFKSLNLTRDFFKDYKKFKINHKNYEEKISLYPVLLEKYQQAGNLGEYFYQDIFMVKKVLEKKYTRHFDIGSRIDGFVGFLSIFKSIEVLDVRSLTSNIQNIIFQTFDITNPSDIGKADLVTCLHTLEHIGLGRYGDRIDVNGWEKALLNMSELLLPKGSLILSTPVGKPRVEFNAHRVFNPNSIIRSAKNYNLELINLYYLDNNQFNKSKNWQNDLLWLSNNNYNLAIFEFNKL